MGISNPKYIKINKPLFDQLFASGLYCYEDKFILEIIAPRDIVRKHTEYDCSNMNIGERWAMNLKEMSESHWPLENASYYIEVNGIKVGKNAGSSTRFRYEPDHGQIEVNNSAIHERMSYDNSLELQELKPTENGLHIPDVSEQKKWIMSVFEDRNFINTLASLLESLPSIDPDNPDDTGKNEEYIKRREKEEELYFSEFRSRTYIPDYLRDKSILLAECIFKGKSPLPFLNEIESLKFIMKSTTKYLLTRARFVLPFGECLIQMKSDEWSIYAEKIWLEGIIESTKEEGKIRNMPAGKKAVFIRYETVDNVLIQPLFYTTDTLLSHHLNDSFMLNNTKHLEEKGVKGFNQYITFAGFVDEQADKADFELFQLVVTYELNKDYILL